MRRRERGAEKAEANPLDGDAETNHGHSGEHSNQDCQQQEKIAFGKSERTRPGSQPLEARAVRVFRWSRNRRVPDGNAALAHGWFPSYRVVIRRAVRHIAIRYSGCQRSQLKDSPAGGGTHGFMKSQTVQKATLE